MNKVGMMNREDLAPENALSSRGLIGLKAKDGFDPRSCTLSEIRTVRVYTV